MTVALVGDVKAAEAFPLVERYFGRLPVRPEAGAAAHRASRRSGRSARSCSRTRRSPSTSRATTGRPSTTPTTPSTTCSSDLLSSGRTSRLYRALVRDKKIAAAAVGLRRLPGREVPEPLRLLRRADARPHARGGPGRDPGRDRAAQDRGRHRRGARDGQDADASADLIRQLDSNQGLRPAARPLPGALRRLARAVPRRRPDREGDQGRHPPRGERDLRRDQPHRGDDPVDPAGRGPGQRRHEDDAPSAARHVRRGGLAAARARRRPGHGLARDPEAAAARLLARSSRSGSCSRTGS